MPPDRICKTIHQYNKGPVSGDDMKKLLEVAEDYRQVKNYVYGRFGGIGSLSKLYPGYTVQNEMTASGLREQLQMPSVYFYLAIFDALGEIKSQWTRTKTKILKLLNRNEMLNADEKHYIRFLMKVNNAFEMVLNEKVPELPEDIQRQHDKLAESVDTEKLCRYLRRQVRKHHVKMHTDTADGFGITERAYRYADHGIYVSIKEKRKRIFIPLTDNNQYRSQLYMKLYPEQGRVEIKVPVKVAVRTHSDYTRRIGISVGVFVMLTTQEGHRYGEKLGDYQTEYAAWLGQQNGSYRINRSNNPGRKKYYARKKRYEEQLHSYINHELNLFFQSEKPQIVYFPKLPKPQAGGYDKKINYSVNLWQRGYIRNRLMQKCMEQSVGFVEGIGAGIGSECSNCGAAGIKKDGVFTCKTCGCTVEEKINTARNVFKRGEEGRILH